MKRMQAKKKHICNMCNSVIDKNDYYYAQSYKDLCEICHEKKKNYSQTVKMTKCFYCKEPAIGVLYGKAICQMHIGQVVDPV